jgi:hypothetical protein
MITDKIAATTLPANETFTTMRAAKSGEVLRGVSFTPGTDAGRLAFGATVCDDFHLCP